MFIKVTKSGARRYAQLVESFRNDEGQPRQRTICTLGRLEAGGDVDTLIASLRRAQGLEAVDSEPRVNPLDGLRFIDSRSASDVWALSQLWHTLGFVARHGGVAHRFRLRRGVAHAPAPAARNGRAR